jgi:hypothetical protein
MELLLNEKSLAGQFEDQDDFYQVLPDMSRNLKILRQHRVYLLKHSSLYTRKITRDMTILDLQNRKGKVDPLQRDEVKRWKRELSSLVMDPPFWDVESTDSEDSLQEAARRKTDVISFPHPDYQDKTLQISYKGGTVPVISAVTTRYLLDLLLQYREINIYEYLKLSYGEGKIRTDYLDAGMESVLALQKAEIEDLREALDRFETEPWTEILKDNFYCYKSYKPSSNKKNYFIHTEFADKQIAKFRCGKHSQIRCFGYREKEYFYILSIERDHSLSDTG